MPADSRGTLPPPTSGACTGNCSPGGGHDRGQEGQPAPLHGAQADLLALDHAPRLASSSRYTPLMSAAVASHENRPAWRRAPFERRVASTGSERILRIRSA